MPLTRPTLSAGPEAQPGPEPHYELIELLFFAYRDFLDDADRLLAAEDFGRAHHRVLYFVDRRPGLAVAELLDILKITKQSLNRVLKRLLHRGYLVYHQGADDRRRRNLYVTVRGTALVRQIAEAQSARFDRACLGAGLSSPQVATAFLAAMMSPDSVRHRAAGRADPSSRLGLRAGER